MNRSGEVRIVSPVSLPFIGWLGGWSVAMKMGATVHARAPIAELIRRIG